MGLGVGRQRELEHRSYPVSCAEEVTAGIVSTKQRVNRPLGFCEVVTALRSSITPVRSPLHYAQMVQTTAPVRPRFQVWGARFARIALKGGIIRNSRRALVGSPFGAHHFAT